MEPDEGRIYASARDVTDRIEVELAYGRLGAIVESSGDAIYVQSLDGAITNWNQAATGLYGYTAGEARRMSTEALMPPDLPDDNVAIIERIARGEVVRDKEAVRMAKGGRRLDVVAPGGGSDAPNSDNPGTSRTATPRIAAARSSRRASHGTHGPSASSASRAPPSQPRT